MHDGKAVQKTIGTTMQQEWEKLLVITVYSYGYMYEQ